MEKLGNVYKVQFPNIFVVKKLTQILLYMWDTNGHFSSNYYIVF